MGHHKDDWRVYSNVNDMTCYGAGIHCAGGG